MILPYLLDIGSKLRLCYLLHDLPTKSNLEHTICEFGTTEIFEFTNNDGVFHQQG